MIEARTLGPAIGRSLPRPRALRLLAGQGRYTDDISLPRMVHAAFLRSPHPHARVASIDVTMAAKSAGVLRVVTGAEIAKHCKTYAGMHQLFPGMRVPEQLPLVIDVARWQGEPVAVVVASSRAQAEDAVERIAVEWEPLAAVFDPFTGAASDSPVIHDSLGSNVAYDGTVSHGDIGATMDAAAFVVENEFLFGRHTGVCLEARSILADYRASDEALTVYASHQCPAQQQDIFARLLGLSDNKVRVVCADVGGAFGIKQQLYGDEIAVCILSKILRRPVKFVADRLESFTSDVHAREHRVKARLGVSAEGRLLGLDVDDWFGIGAYSQYPRSSVGEGSHVLRMTGAAYDIRSYRARMRMVLQNKNMVGHYRSVGHPIAIAVGEVLIDDAARKLGIDPVEIRRRNYIPEAGYPHTSHGGFVFEQLSLHACLNALITLMDLPGLRRDKEESRRKGVYRGIGLASFVELTGTGPDYYGKGEVRVTAQDGCMVKLEPSGKIRCFSSVTDQGQGVDTAIGQVMADSVGVPFDDVAVFSGDTEISPYGGGAWASRGASMGGEAAVRAGRALRDNILVIAASVLQAGPGELTIKDGAVINAVDGRSRMTLAEIARIGYFRQDLLPSNVQPDLSVVRHYVPHGRMFIPTNGIQASYVEVDPDTGFIRLLRHFVVHDGGTMINPMLVEEQIRGGVVQGLGAALYEEIAYGAEGELTTGTMADYLLPMAFEMPDIDIGHVSVPLSGTAIGAKGVGEAGTAGAAAAVLNAVNDALAPLNGHLTQLPMSPERVLRALGKID